MSEYIGSRISLISNSDIRYVGTLHEINSEAATVALEHVVSHGTEGRRNNAAEEIAASDNVYDYIVFRGKDVKDLKIQEPTQENKPPEPPQVPDDPAILGSGSRPPNYQTQQSAQASPFQQRQPQPPQFQQPPPFPYYYPPPPGQRFGPQGGPQAFPPGPGFPGMAYGAPPGWYPPPGQGFSPHPQFMPPPMATGFPGQQRQQGLQSQQSQPSQPSQQSQQSQQQQQPPQPPSTTSTTSNQQKPKSQQQSPEKKTINVKIPSQSTTPVPGVLPVPAQKGPTPPIESKPDVATALAPSTTSSAQVPAALGKIAPTGPKSGHIMPAVPLASPGIKPATTSKGPLQASSGNTVQTSTPAGSQSNASHPSQTAAASLQDATRAATAAVAAAMAKLPPAPSQKKQPADGVDHLTKKVDEMRTHDHIRHSRHPGTGGYAAGNRGGGRGGHRGGRHHEPTKKVEVPTTDYDFQSANAKFNKQDLVKEAIASGSPVGTPGDAPPATNGSSDASVNGRKGSEHSLATPAAGGSYNKSTSFFDNISSESKDRDDANGAKPGGREWRGEEQKKNLETFGASSVDNGYRGGFRGRGRGRGFGRGRGGGGGGYAGGAQGARNGTGTGAGRGGFRGGRSGAISTET